ncbi:hypothetical protein NHX12_026451 [Muraenolepis orangiensis]|uniref:microsomal epoxide hydrolase n=1 Tax=Muraenolepis orangiensis TaxID=630683 RepID=A0A9Q0EK89_9TELE|nr:hypothetical protein NHX12_026451 [Muraenolepis orangiensis]
MFVEVMVTVVLGTLGALVFFRRTRRKLLTTEDGWWGAGELQLDKEDPSIRPFTFHYGFNSDCLAQLVSYWKRDFNWKRQVDKINQYPHYKTNIEGIDVHYVHVKPLSLPVGARSVPVVLVHGWPGSFYEFYGLIPLLLAAATDGPHPLHLEIICPSLPGYGYSEAPHKKGFDAVCAARVLHKLMQRLGFQQFYAHGGDWGSLVTTCMAQLEPDVVKGLHINMALPIPPNAVVMISMLLGRYFPRLFGFTPFDLERIYPCLEKMVVGPMSESGYMHIQGTKPDTAGRGLNDSPVGLAAYILEKFSTWTDKSFKNLEDGGLTRKFSLDDLLTNVMIYWTSGCIVSSMRFYKENLQDMNKPHTNRSSPTRSSPTMSSPTSPSRFSPSRSSPTRSSPSRSRTRSYRTRLYQDTFSSRRLRGKSEAIPENVDHDVIVPGIPVYVPTGMACFPNELMHTTRLWVKQKYHQLRSFSIMARGGHFAAMEEPQLMAQDLLSFIRTLEDQK